MECQFIDIAANPSGNPLGTWLEYQIDSNATGANDFCDYPTMGYDYWAMWVSCISYDGSQPPPIPFIGNRVFGFSIGNMLGGGVGTFWHWANIPTDLNCSTGCSPAFRLSPATEDGVPVAEWVLADDVAYNTASSNLTACSVTQTYDIGTATAPTFTCIFQALPLSYANPISADQPSNLARSIRAKASSRSTVAPAVCTWRCRLPLLAAALPRTASSGPTSIPL